MPCPPQTPPTELRHAHIFIPDLFAHPTSFLSDAGQFKVAFEAAQEANNLGTSATPAAPATDEPEVDESKEESAAAPKPEVKSQIEDISLAAAPAAVSATEPSSEEKKESAEEKKEA